MWKSAAHADHACKDRRFMQVMRVFPAFYAYAGTYCMDIDDIQRRVQFRQGSYMVTIPAQIAHALGMRKNQYVRFAVSKNKVIIKPVESGITKRDVAEADRDSAALDRYDGPREDDDDAGYMDALAEALSEGGPDGDGGDGGGGVGSRMEKLRMR